MNRAMVAITAGTAALAAVVGATAGDGVGAHDRSARANLVTADGTELGAVTFESDHGTTQVRVLLSGTPGLDAFHGFHVHANDVAANGEGCLADPAAAPSTWFVSADGHYNPTAAAHGHHAGDMPVVYVNADGTVETRFSLGTLDPNDLDGKVVILHAAADNYANIPLGAGPTQYTANSADASAATARTGNAGDRIACGVIVVK